jgi:hypothetical protein
VVRRVLVSRRWKTGWSLGSQNWSERLTRIDDLRITSSTVPAPWRHLPSRTMHFPWIFEGSGSPVSPCGTPITRGGVALE